MSKEPLPLAVVWQQCLDLEKCAQVWPFPEVCIGVHACLSVILENGTYYVEADVLGQRFRWPLTDACYTVFTIAVGHIDICINPRAGGLRLQARACISVGPINQCWDIYGVDINFLRLGDLEPAQRDYLTMLGRGLPQGSHDDRVIALTDTFEQSGVRNVKSCPCR